MKIEWEKYPEATNYDKRPGCSPAFMRKHHNGRDWEYIGMGGYWVMYGPIPDSQLADLIKRPTEFTGEGPPPAGTLCELRLKSGDWGKATIKYMSLDVCVWLWFRPEALIRQTELGAEVRNMEFRPIRTPEQIAADARQTAAIDLYRAVMDHSGNNFFALPEDRQDHYLKLIDEGWTKVSRA